MSEDTIRRDLQELADEGKLIKVHGGALSRSFNNYYLPENEIYSFPQKKKIALKAISLMQDGMFILTSGGTTVIETAKALPPELKATFMSGSLPVLMEYMNHPNIDVIVIGDKVSKNSKITTGGDALQKIRQIRADLCILGINAIDENGVTDNDWDVVQLKQAMIESAKTVVCLSILEKVNTSQPIHVCPLNKIDILITESDPDNPLLLPYKEAGIRVM